MDSPIDDATVAQLTNDMLTIFELAHRFEATLRTLEKDDIHRYQAVRAVAGSRSETRNRAVSGQFALVSGLARAV